MRLETIGPLLPLEGNGKLYLNSSATSLTVTGYHIHDSECLFCTSKQIYLNSTLPFDSIP